MNLPESFKPLRENFHVLTALLAFCLLAASFYLFYLKKAAEEAVWGGYLRPDSKIFVVYLYDLGLLLTTIILASLCLKFIFLADEKGKKEKRLQAEIDDKDEILSVASHELYSPLTNIKNTLSVLQPEVSASYRKFDERAIQSAEQLIKLLDDLLTVSRFQRGKIKINREPWSMEELCAEVIAEFSEAAQKAGVNLKLEAPPKEAPTPQFDHVRIKEVLVNFVSNAIKYAAPGEVIIKISAGKGLLEVSVCDRGPGIKKEELSSLFRKFVRLENTGSQKQHGVGLGLYISRLIIEAHKGKIWAESPPAGGGRGSAFHFSLPF